MKLLRYGPVGKELPGILDLQGHIRSLATIIPDITHEVVTPEGLAQLAKLDLSTLTLVEGATRLGPPIAAPRQFMALGLNYTLHAKEAGVAVPTQPMIFSKAITCISGATDNIPLYPCSDKLDYEAELAIVIGRRTHRVSERHALDHVAGYTICNDVSDRGWQIERGGSIVKGKSAPGFGPLGPWLVTADEVTDPQHLRIRTLVNGVVKQDGSTSDMIFSVAAFIAHLSEFMELLPGDVVTTGTPAGVALGMKPPVWLKAGDEVLVEIEGLGELRQRVVAVS